MVYVKIHVTVLKIVATVTKTIKGRTYLYFTYYDPNTRSKKEVYCGLENNPDSKNKALELEYNKLQEQKRQLSLRMDSLRDQIKKSKVKKVENF